MQATKTNYSHIFFIFAKHASNGLCELIVILLTRGKKGENNERNHYKLMRYNNMLSAC